MEVLVKKTIRAAQERGVEKLGLSGGVAANRRLRQVMQRSARQGGHAAFRPAPGALYG